jgi:rhodanese-related sulfurtransferase
MSQLLDCMVTYFSTGEDDKGLPPRYFCYHILAGPGMTPDGGVASIIALSSHDHRQDASEAGQDFHAVRVGGPEYALHRALAYLDAFHAEDCLNRATSDIRRPTTGAAVVEQVAPVGLNIKMSPAEVIAAMKSGRPLTILDVRTDAARHESLYRIRGAIRVSPALLPENPPWPRDRLLVVYCSCPADASSVMIAQELRSLGYKQAYSLAGGFDAWRAADGPTEAK